MKRLVLALSILAAEASLFCALQYSTVQSRNESAAAREAWLAQTQLLTRTQTQRAELRQRIVELKRSLATKTHGTSKSPLADLVLTNRPLHLAPLEREQLLAELGFDWNSSGDYLVVSKESLSSLSFSAIRDHRLTDTVCSILAITPGERANVEATMERLAMDYRTWASAHVERVQPEGEVLAKYTMPANPEFSQSLSNRFSAGIMAELGSERGELMLGYAWSWMNDLGMRGGGPTTLTIKHPLPGQEWLPFELKMPDGGTMFTAVTPQQPFPESFRAVFPGGWRELAEREAFELPKEFQNFGTGR